MFCSASLTFIWIVADVFLEVAVEKKRYENEQGDDKTAGNNNPYCE
jgi:hypothetical protein